MNRDHSLQSDAWAEVYRWAYRFLRDHHGALDATQEVMLRAVQSRGAEIQNDLGWLRRVTINHCIDARRKKRPLQTEVLESVDESTSPLRAMIASETTDTISRALSRLTEQQQAVLLAKTYDGQTFAAIAESMHLSIGTVKTHYLRALRTMRNTLGQLKEYS